MSDQLVADRGARDDERVPTDPRLSRRRRAARRLRRRRIAARAAWAVAAIAVVYAALFSPLLRVRAVEIEGGRHTTPAEVASAARLDASDNLLLLSTASVADAAERLPWVRAARVERKLPGTVRVTITERRPALTLEAAGRKWTLDRNGRVLAAGRGPRRLPRVIATQTSPRVGRQVPRGPARGAIATLRSLGARLGRDVATVYASGAAHISLRLADDTIVRWGSPYRRRAKESVLRALLRRLRAEDVRPAYVDVSVPANPAVAPESAAAPALDPLRASGSRSSGR